MIGKTAKKKGWTTVIFLTLPLISCPYDREASPNHEGG